MKRGVFFTNFDYLTQLNQDENFLEFYLNLVRTA